MGGEPRKRSSGASKARIVQAAREIFTGEGYDRATVRMIAARAGVNPALIIRYFGSKEALFASAVHFDLQLPEDALVDPERIGILLVEHFLERWEGGGQDGDLSALLRAGIVRETARLRLIEIFQEQLTVFVARFAGQEHAATRAGLIASQMLGLALGRYVLELPGLVTSDRATMVRLIGPTIQRYIEDRSVDLAEVT